MKYIYFFILFLGITATIEGETKTTILLSNSSSIFLKGVLGFQSSFRGETEIKFLEDLKTQERNFIKM